MPPSMLVRLAAIGLAAGVFSALFGVGGGTVIVPMLIMFVAFAPREAAATSLGAIAITAVAGVVAYAFRGEIRYSYAALIGVPAAVGALAGTALQQRLSSRALSVAFALLLAGIGAWLLAG